MNVKEIKELVELVSRRGLAGLEIERAGFRLRIEGAPVHRGTPAFARAVADPVAAEAPALPPAGPMPVVAPHVPPGPAGSGEREGFHVITAPIVGTFYRAANPDAEPFVKVGDVVEKGKTLCIVEAMKLMNEIESDVSGTVVSIFPQNAQPVEFGEKLFAIQPR
ncbi:MAG: acetyl-CoA carboxylase biotin carboxyl carrier protein [Thermoanaerobaculia bacterium]|nr:acetyl-CoA carboxylase biotin carboxyl carrier protein [Thermoanaerobaculia bacterium]